MYLYHATKYKNLLSIIEGGLLPGYDGMIYFTTSEQHSVNWIDMTNLQGEDLLVIRIDSKDLDENLIEDGMDHSPTFFKGITVKTYSGHIPSDLIHLEGMTKFISKHNPKYYQ